LVWIGRDAEIGDRVVDTVPNSIKTLAIDWFGTNDKVALLTGIGAVLTLYAVVLGIVALTRFWRLAIAGAAAFGLIGAYASQTSRRAAPWWAVAPSIAGGLVAALVLVALRRVLLGRPALAQTAPGDPAGSTKVTHFIQSCEQAGLPIVWLQNTTGFIVGTEAERAGMIKHGSKQIQALSNATVPQITIQCGASYGAGNYGMCGRAYSPRFLWMWPNARISVMGGEQAASVLAQVKRDGIEAKGGKWSKEEEEAFKAPIREQYERQGHPYYATARLWDDGVIDPIDTRRVLGLALAVALNAPVEDTRFGDQHAPDRAVRDLHICSVGRSGGRVHATFVATTERSAATLV
jgi:hypothetical protein